MFPNQLKAFQDWQRRQFPPTDCQRLAAYKAAREASGFPMEEDEKVILYAGSLFELSGGMLVMGEVDEHVLKTWEDINNFGRLSFDHPSSSWKLGEEQSKIQWLISLALCGHELASSYSYYMREDLFPGEEAFETLFKIFGRKPPKEEESVDPPERPE